MCLRREYACATVCYGDGSVPRQRVRREGGGRHVPGEGGCVPEGVVDRVFVSSGARRRPDVAGR